MLHFYFLFESINYYDCNAKPQMILIEGNSEPNIHIAFLSHALLVSKSKKKIYIAITMWKFCEVFSINVYLKDLR